MVTQRSLYQAFISHICYLQSLLCFNYLIIYGVTHTHAHTLYVYRYSIYIWPSVLISLYGTRLVQRASYLPLQSSLFGPDGTVNYDYIVTNSINSLAQDVFLMAHTLTIFGPRFKTYQNLWSHLIFKKELTLSHKII